LWRKKVLVIDDEENILHILKIRLENEGYEVITTTDPVDGIGKAFFTIPDLILLDITMPKLSGFEVLKVVSQSDDLKNIPIIMLTARREPQDIEKVLKLGAVDYCAKPFEWNVLKGKIEKAIKVEEGLKNKHRS